MSTSTPNKYPVFLSKEQRDQLDQITRCGHSPAKRIRHAQVLLLADRNNPDGYLTRTQIAELLNMHVNTVDRIKKLFSNDGVSVAINRKPREVPPRKTILDGESEAHLIAICCASPPSGRQRWTMKLLSDELMNRKIVTQISPETVRRALKKTNLNLG